MSKRELTNLICEGTMTTASRLRSGAGESSHSEVQDMEDDTNVEGAGDSHVVRELQQKRSWNRCELTLRSSFSKQGRWLSVQRKRVSNSIARFTSWNADNEKWRVEIETMRMKIELDGLKQLEEVRRQFDKKRARHREELENDVALIVELKEKLATLESAVPPGDPGALELQVSCK